MSLVIRAFVSHRREKADVALISYNFGQHGGSFPDDARVDRSHCPESYFKITVVDMKVG